MDLISLCPSILTLAVNYVLEKNPSKFKIISYIN